MERSAIIRGLTLEQKCALLSGKDNFCTRDFPGQGIFSIRLSDGPNGLRKQTGKSDHLGINPSTPATCFPTAVTVANSWNPELAQQIGEAMGKEAAAQSVDVLLAPGLNIKRNPLCGRNFEYFSEDPYLSGKMAAGYIRGIQAAGVAACPKHFAVNNQETRRMASDSIVDERTLREIYLTGFEIAVKEGRPKTIMSAYNLVNGEYANENKHLLTDILRKEWGFEGAVVTDWGGSNDHTAGVKCGSTLEMPAAGNDSVRELLCAVQNGEITPEEIDRRVEELLPLVLEKKDQKQSEDLFLAHHELACKAAAEGIVLLKNEDGILPLKREQKAAVIGRFAKEPRCQGAGSSAVNATRLDTVLERLPDSPVTCIGYASGWGKNAKENERCRAEAVKLAKEADVVLLFLGLEPWEESEGLDRRHMKISEVQTELLRNVQESNPNIVVLLHAGCAVETPWKKYCKGLIYAALGGQGGARAELDVLTGRVNPSGKLAESWPVCYEDVPSGGHFAGKGKRVEYREGPYVGYRYYHTAKIPVAYPFGYGLSYTSFACSDPVVLVNPENPAQGSVSVVVTNTGKRAGAEIVQLYISKKDPVVFRPKQELKGFAKVFLQPGESRRVPISLDDKTFRYWEKETGRFEIEPGGYEIRIGVSSEDIRCSCMTWLEGTRAAVDGKAPECYRTGQVKNVSDRDFEDLLGRKLPAARPQIDQNLTFGELKYARSPIGWLVCFVMTLMLKISLKRQKAGLNLLFVYNMPLRAVAKMTGGAVSMGMIDGLVMELKGFWIIGLVRFVLEFFRNQLTNRKLEKKIAGER